jgi:hypothetical protein
LGFDASTEDDEVGGGGGCRNGFEPALVFAFIVGAVVVVDVTVSRVTTIAGLFGCAVNITSTETTRFDFQTPEETRDK